MYNGICCYHVTTDFALDCVLDCFWQLLLLDQMESNFHGS